MASVQDIKRRVNSVKNTRKITKAMELVAAAKLRRAEARIASLRPYADRMREHVRSVAILPLTGDRGLAGGFNAQVVRRALALEREARDAGQDVHWLVAGKKGRSTLRFRRYDIADAWVDFTDRPAYSDARAIAHSVAERFTTREVDRVVMVYNQYVS